MTSLASPIPASQSLETAETLVPMADVAPAQTTRLQAYSKLAKPRIGLMVVVAAGVGFILAGQQQATFMGLVHACIGILASVVAASSFNQILERNTDALMPRTQYRPLACKRLAVWEVTLFACILTVGSCAYLYVMVNPLTAWLTLFTIASYSFIYTPLKRFTSLSTVIGAVPGAMPPVLGWTAAGGSLDWGAFALFALMFVWQFPHFLAIAWLYQDQYSKAGLKMLPADGKSGITGSIAATYAAILIPVSLLPKHLELTGNFYAFVAVFLGIMYLISSILFQRCESRREARLVLWVSLIYLPVVLVVMVVDHLRLVG